MNQPKKWFKWLSLAQRRHNTSFHSSIKMSPFQALFRYSPPSRALSTKEVSSMATVEEVVTNRINMDQFLQK